MHNYSKEQQSVVTEEIKVESDDEVPPLDGASGFEKVLRDSNLNKQVLNLITDYKKNVPLMLHKILEVLLQHRNIAYRDVILNLIKIQCKKIETNLTSNEVIIDDENVRSNGHNSDNSDDLQSLFPKLKVAKLDTEKKSCSLNQKELPQRDQEYNQHMQPQHHLQRAFHKSGGGSTRDELESQAAAKQTEPVTNHMSQGYSNSCNVSYSNQYQNPGDALQDNNEYQASKYYSKKLVATQFQPTNAQEELLLPLQWPQKHRSCQYSADEARAHKTNWRRQTPISMGKTPPNSPTRYMASHPIIHHDRYRRRTYSHPIPSPPEQFPPRKVATAFQLRETSAYNYQNMQDHVPSNNSMRNMPIMPSQNQYHMPYPENQGPMNQLEMVAGSPINTYTPAKAPYTASVYPSHMNTEQQMMMPATVYAPVTPPMRKRGIDRSAVYPIDMPNASRSDIDLTGAAAMSLQTNPYKMGYGNPVRMPQDMKHHRRQTSALDAQINDAAVDEF